MRPVLRPQQQTITPHFIEHGTDAAHGRQDRSIPLGEPSQVDMRVCLTAAAEMGTVHARDENTKRKRWYAGIAVFGRSTLKDGEGMRWGRQDCGKVASL